MKILKDKAILKKLWHIHTAIKYYVAIKMTMCVSLYIDLHRCLYNHNRKEDYKRDGTIWFHFYENIHLQ